MTPKEITRENYEHVVKVAAGVVAAYLEERDYTFANWKEAMENSYQEGEPFRARIGMLQDNIERLIADSARAASKEWRDDRVCYVIPVTLDFYTIIRADILKRAEGLVRNRTP